MVKKDNSERKRRFWHRGLLKRSVSFLLSAALIMTNIGNPANLAFGAASAKEEFRIHKEAIQLAIEKALDEGVTFDGAELEIDGKDKSLVKNYQRLLEENVTLLEIHPEIETVKDVDGIDLRVFVCLEEGTDLQGYVLTGEERLIFLYVNEGDETVSGRINIDGYVTNFCTLKTYENAFGKKVPAEGAPGESKPEGIGAGEESQEKGTESSDAEAAPGEETDKTEAPAEEADDAEASAEETDKAEIPAEETDKAEAPSKDGTDDSSAPAAEGTEDPAEKEPEDGKDSSDETAASGDDSRENQSSEGKEESKKDNDEDKAKPEKSPAVKEPEHQEDKTAPEGKDGQEESKKEGSEDQSKAEGQEKQEEGSEEKNEKPDHKEETEKSELNEKENREEKSEPEEKEPQEEKIKPEEKEVQEEKSEPEEKEAQEEKSEPKEERSEKSDEKPEPKEREEQAGKPEPQERENSRDFERQEISASISRHMVAVVTASDASDSDADKVTEPETENEEEEEDGDGDPFDAEDAAALKEETVSFNRIGVLEGRTYGLVSLGDSMSARAFVVSVSKIGIEAEELEESGHQITYTIDPVGSANLVKAPELVRDEAKVVFGVKPFDGYQVMQASANGIVLEIAAQEGDGSAQDAADGIIYYEIPEVLEDQEVEIVMAEEDGIAHPEFFQENTINGVTITIFAEEGILPEGTKAVVTEVTSQVEDAVKEKEGQEKDASEERGEVSSVLAYDIKLVDQNGKELDNSWSSNGYVDVTFSGSRIEKESKDADAVEIKHLDLDGEIGQEKITAEDIHELEKVGDAVDVSGDKAVGAVAFSAEHFSVYVVNFTVTASGYAAAGTIFVRLKDSNGREIVLTEDEGQRSYRFADELGEEAESAQASSSMVLNASTSTSSSGYAITDGTGTTIMGSLKIEKEITVGDTRYCFDYAQAEKNAAPVTISRVRYLKSGSKKQLEFKDPKTWTAFSLEDGKAYIDLIFAADDAPKTVVFNFLDEAGQVIASGEKDASTNYFGQSKFNVINNYTQLGVKGIETDFSEFGIKNNGQLIKLSGKYYWIANASTQEESGSVKAVSSIRYYWNAGKDKLELQYVPTASGTAWKAVPEKDGKYEISIHLQEIAQENLKETVKFHFVDESGNILKTEERAAVEYFSSGSFAATEVNGITSKLGIKNNLAEIDEKWYGIQELRTAAGEKISNSQYYWDDGLRKLAFRYKSSSSSSKWSALNVEGGSYDVRIALKPCVNPAVTFHMIDEEGKEIHQPITVNAISELVYVNSAGNHQITTILEKQIQGFENGAIIASDGTGYVFKDAAAGEINGIAYIAYQRNKDGIFELKYGSTSSTSQWKPFPEIADKMDINCQFSKINEKVIFHIVDTDGKKIAEDKEINVYPALKGSNGVSIAEYSKLNEILTFDYADEGKRAIVGNDNQYYSFKEAMIDGVSKKINALRYHRTSVSSDFVFGYKTTSFTSMAKADVYEVNLKFEKLNAKIVFECKWGQESEKIEKEVKILPGTSAKDKTSIEKVLKDALNIGEMVEKDGKQYILNSVKVGTKKVSGLISYPDTNGIQLKFIEPSTYSEFVRDFTMTPPTITLEFMARERVYFDPIDESGNVIKVADWKEIWLNDIPSESQELSKLLGFSKTQAITDVEGNVYEYIGNGKITDTKEYTVYVRCTDGKLMYKSGPNRNDWKEVPRDKNGNYSINPRFKENENARLLRMFIEEVNKLPDHISEDNIDSLKDIVDQFDACKSAYEKVNAEYREKGEAQKAYKKYSEVKEQYEGILESRIINAFLEAVDEVSESVKKDLSDSLKKTIKKQFAACDNAYAALTPEQKQQEEVAEAYKKYVNAREEYQKKLEESNIEPEVKAFLDTVEKVVNVSKEDAVSRELEGLFKACEDAYEALTELQKEEASVVMAKETFEAIKKQYYGICVVKINDMYRSTLQEAIDEIDGIQGEDSEIIISLMDNIVVSESVKINNKKPFTINMGGYMINYAADEGNVFEISGSTVTFIGGERNSADEASKETAIEITSSNESNMIKGSIVISSGNIEFDHITLDGGERPGSRVLTIEGGNVVFADGKIQGGRVSNENRILGGGIYIANGTLTLNKATIEKNTAYHGAGIYVAGGNVYVNDSHVIRNTANVKGSDGGDKNVGGLGGGIYIAGNGTVELNGSVVEGNEAGISSGSFTRQLGAGGGIYVDANAAFTMNDSTVIDNRAYAYSIGETVVARTSYGGGGICIQEASEKIKLNSGRIANNYSDAKGGGIYIHTGKLQLEQVKITGNEAINKTFGSGIWYCDVGDGQFYATSGGYISKNIRTQGTDFYSYYQPGPWGKNIHLPTRLYNGTNVAWYEDDGVSKLEKLKKIDDLDQYLKDHQNTSKIALISELEDNSGESGYQLTISGNEARDGGGIACNGNLIIGRDEDVTIKVKKIWQDENRNDITADSVKHPTSIKVDLWRLGKDGGKEKKLDADVELNAANNWSYTFKDLPSTYDYEVAEQPIDGWKMERKEVSGEDGKEIIITLSNKPDIPEPDSGYLRIRKTLLDADGGEVKEIRTFYYCVKNVESGEYLEIPVQYRPTNHPERINVGQITNRADDIHELLVEFGVYEITETDEEGKAYVGGGKYIVINPENVTINAVNADVAASIINKEKPEETTPEETTPEETSPSEEPTTEPTTPEEPSPSEEPTTEPTTPEETSPSEEPTTPEETIPTEPTTPSESPENPTTPSRPSGGGGGGRDRDRNPSVTPETTPIPPEEVPLANIDPEDVPMAMMPSESPAEAMVIDDEGVPLFGLPKTGDRGVPAGALIGMMLLSLMAACGIQMKKHKDEE